MLTKVEKRMQKEQIVERIENMPSEMVQSLRSCPDLVCAKLMFNAWHCSYPVATNLRYVVWKGC